MVRIWKSIVNFIYYRQPRNLSGKKIKELSYRVSKSSELSDLRRLTAEIMLMKIGLRLVDEETNDFVYLTKQQRAIKQIAEQHGYKVGC